LLGYLAAISGGLLLGMLYLGVDIKTTANDLLRKTELIEPESLAMEPGGPKSLRSDER